MTPSWKKKKSGSRQSKNKLSPLNAIIRPLTKKALHSNQTAYSQILLEWSHIVDPTYSQVLKPIKTTHHAKTNQTTLHLESQNKSAVFFMQYEQSAILEAITRFFGRPLIHSLRLHVAPHKVDPLTRPRAQWAPDEKKELYENIATIADKNLAQQLIKLAGSINES